MIRPFAASACFLREPVRRRAILVVVLAATLTSCGKKGPPLPPFVRIPAQPGEFAAARRGDSVAISFLVPDVNADESRPANVDRVEIYAITASPRVSDENIRRYGQRIATVRVNPPPDPDAPDRPSLEGGVDQGALATITEILTADAREPAELPATAAPVAPAERTGGPLLPPPVTAVSTRVYIAVPIGGRRTGASSRAAVPLAPAPSPPPPARVTYDEDQLTIDWTPSAGDAAPAAPAGLLPSRPLTAVSTVAAYHVYETSDEEGMASERRLTSTPVNAPPFVDPRVEFGQTRCYLVRVSQRVGTLSVESDAPPPTCVTMVDTFPPQPPSGLTTVPSEGAISLIWDPSDAADLAGYFLLRGQPGGGWSRITPTVLDETSFRDTLPAGTRAVYAVQAVDREGNVSDPSLSVEDTAR